MSEQHESELEEWEHHIKHSHMDRKGFAWCGAAILERGEFLIQDLDHAANCLQQNTRVQPCPACVRVVAALFSGEEVKK